MSEIIVTFTGAQGSGKTSAMAALTFVLCKNGWRVEVDEDNHKLRLERPVGKERQLSEMTDEELLTEYQKWETKIKTATSWGAGLAAASEFRMDCVREIEIRRQKYLKRISEMTDEELSAEWLSCDSAEKGTSCLRESWKRQGTPSTKGLTP